MSESKRNATVLGVTGGIACGKSEVGRILEAMGFAVCDSDRVAHDLMKKGTTVHGHVVGHFGAGILQSDGEISRPALGSVVFENPTELQILNEMVHPAVREYLENWIAIRRSKNEDAAVMVPLLFESGMETLDWDAVLCVSDSYEKVLQRLLDRGLGRDQAEARIRSQMPLGEKERKSDWVVPNTGTLEELETATRECVEKIRAER